VKRDQFDERNHVDDEDQKTSRTTTKTQQKKKQKTNKKQAKNKQKTTK
jgi:hypothetical protein